MTSDQILKVLKNERECIARQSRPLGEMPQCRKDEDGVKLCEYCDLCLPDDEILAVYDHLISLVEAKVLIVGGEGNFVHYTEADIEPLDIENDSEDN